ncbi:hypothetical protein BDF21DRAFT_425452 [Thamnidium elegans]|nr:hypothetical protein BDF21DRAFT_425452 [Thamnidium elegans]
MFYLFFVYLLTSFFLYTKALKEMSAKFDGKITCPRTGQVFNFDELKKVFIS